jgi:hypothetical protein
LPQCLRCLLFTSNAQTARHQQSKTCAAGYARKIRRLQQLANESGETTTLYVNGTAIKNVDSFRYLGRILTATDDDQLAIVHNLQKAKRSWRRTNHTTLLGSHTTHLRKLLQGSGSVNTVRDRTWYPARVQYVL